MHPPRAALPLGKLGSNVAKAGEGGSAEKHSGVPASQLEDPEATHWVLEARGYRAQVSNRPYLPHLRRSGQEARVAGTKRSVAGD